MKLYRTTQHSIQLEIDRIWTLAHKDPERLFTEAGISPGEFAKLSHGQRFVLEASLADISMSRITTVEPEHHERVLQTMWCTSLLMAMIGLGIKKIDGSPDVEQVG